MGCREGRQAGRSVVACTRAESVCLSAPATHRKHLGIVVQSLQQRARHHLSMECVHDANGMEGTKVRRRVNDDNGARAMRTQRTPPRSRKSLEAERPIAGQLPTEADTVVL